MIVGTPTYMAPEQATGQPEAIGPWTDLYSVGIVFFEMLAGQPPFEGTPMVVLGKILHEPPPALSRFRPNLDPKLEAILLQALLKEPAARFRSARQFSEALADLTVAVAPACMATQSADQPTPNRSVLEPKANGTTWVQIVVRICGVLATGLGVGLLATGIATAASRFGNDWGPSLIGLGAGSMVIGMMTLAWSFWKWTHERR